MKALKKGLVVLAVLAAVLATVFLAGRYGWKVLGFRACQEAGITAVEVREKAVRITGFYPGSFPEGFCGYCAKEEDGKLYVGFRFSAVFGFFETGDFDITIPVKGEISEVLVKTRMHERTVWNGQAGLLSQAERCGVYVKVEQVGVYAVSMSYEGFSRCVSHADNTALDSGTYCFMDNDIMMASKDAGAPVSFTLTVKDGAGAVTASGTFFFDAGMEKMYLTVTRDGRIVEDKDNEG